MWRPIELTPEVAEVATRVVALRRLEERLAAGAGPRDSADTRQRLAIDTDGRVACPRGGVPHFTACLGCRDLAALVTTPPTVVCAGPLTGATSGAEG